MILDTDMGCAGQSFYTALGLRGRRGAALSFPATMVDIPYMAGQTSEHFQFRGGQKSWSRRRTDEEEEEAEKKIEDKETQGE